MGYTDEFEGDEIKVLDHGYIRLVEHWGEDARIIEAARMSTGKGFLGWGNGEKPGDEKLLRFLWENKHHTPFEMVGVTIEVQAPIFVFREWHRHRVPFSYNEMSARYTPLPDVNYIPSVERLLMNSKTNKQAGVVAGADELTVAGAESFRQKLRDMYNDQQTLYEISLARGVPKELARVHLPVGRYSRMRASSNLRGWINFLVLRSDRNPGAQWEIRQYANALADILRGLFPPDDAALRRGLLEVSVVDHPRHYNAHPSGVECIDVVEHMTFNVGNAVKYVWRTGLKVNAHGDIGREEIEAARIEDLKKARWYLDREISRLEKSR